MFKKTTKLANGDKVSEGDLISFIDSDGIAHQGRIKKRAFKCFHQETGKILKKGSLFFWNIGFEPSDYKNAIRRVLTMSMVLFTLISCAPNRKVIYSENPPPLPRVFCRNDSIVVDTEKVYFACDSLGNFTLRPKNGF